MCGGFFIFSKILIMKLAGLVALLTCLVHSSFAQEIKPKLFKAPLCGSVVLSEVEDKYSAQVYNLEMPEVEGNNEAERLRELKQQVARTFPYKAGPARKKTTTALQPIIGVTLTADTVTGIPPDNYMAISKGKKAVSVVNSNIEIYNGATGAFLYMKNLKAMSVAVGLNNFTNDFRYDPKIVYDPEADRFIMVMLNGTNQYNYIVFAFSKTNDPAGAWNFYKFYGDYTGDTTWFDYPAISITHNEIFLTGNKIKYDSSWQAGFKKTLIYQVKKQDGYNGAATLNYQIWDSVQYNGKYLRCLYPVNPGDVVLGPEQYLLSNRNFDVLNDTVFLVKVPDTIGGTGSISVTPLVSTLSYGAPPDARQPDTAKSLATNDARVLGGFLRGNDIQFVNTSVNPATGASAIYHGVISNFATAPTLQGRIFGVDTLDLGYPNISYAGNTSGVNNAILSFNFSGPGKFPSSGAVFFDGTNFSDLLTIKSGATSISILSGKEQRWGDYSGSQPEWGAPGVVWVEGIFGGNNHQYASQMTQLISPYFSAVKEQEAAKPSKVFPNPAFELIRLEFTMVGDQLMTFSICDVNGRVVDQLPQQYCREGRNLIQFNIGSLAPGMYFLKGSGAQGYTVETQKFTKSR